MANADRYYIGANDEHGQEPPTEGKRTPVMPYVGRSFYENEFNRPAKYYFLAGAVVCGFNVYDVKPETGDLSVAARVARINRRRLDALVTFAYNAEGNGENFNSVLGFEVFFSRENGRVSASRLLAYDLSAGLAEKLVAENLGAKNLGVGTLSGVGVLGSVNCPSALCECGFMTNFQEAKLMLDPDYQRLCAEGALAGVCNTFAVPLATAADYENLPVLRRGSRGKAVQLAQIYFNLNGAELDPDGVFGPETLAETLGFQRQNSLEADGIIGRETWRTLLRKGAPPVLREGSRGTFVRYLQQKLLSKLYPAGGVDGIFGPKTRAAVEAFQTENSLVVDGVVGRATWEKLTPIGGGRPLP